MDERARKTITKYVEDMHSLVTYGLQPMRQQVGQAGQRQHPEAQQAIQAFVTTLEGHVSRLDSRLKALGTSPTTGVQDAASTVAGAVAGLYSQVRTEAVSKSLRDNYTFLSHCSIAWLMLATTARSLGDHDTEELAEEGYRDCARMVMQIDNIMPRLVVAELRQDGLTAQDVSEWADRIVRSAWTTSGVQTGSTTRTAG
jgi:ferritin-like metal-binding protein YciE